MAAVAFVAALVAAGVALSSCKDKPAATTRPNVLLLVMDTTRADRCTFDGYARPTTPRLAELAKDAVVYRDAWTPGSWTGPAHASLFTGLRPTHHAYEDGVRSYLGPESKTLAELLAAAGYATGCFTNNPYIAPGFGLTRGFQTYEPLFQDDKRPLPWARRTHALAAAFAEAAHGAGRPFFVFVNDMEPHMPYAPPEEDARRFLPPDAPPAEVAWARGFGYPELWAHVQGKPTIPPERIRLLSDLYDGEIASLDREIGVLLDRLRDDGLLDNTLVVITADHGESLGEHGMLTHTYDLHRCVAQVPLLLRLPGKFDGGRAVPEVVRLEDLAPTIFEACNVPAPPGMDGISLAGDLDGRIARATRGTSDDVRRRFEAQFPGFDASHMTGAIRSAYDGRHHLLVYADGRVELYDVPADPLEERNLAATQPDVVARLRPLLD